MLNSLLNHSPNFLAQRAAFQTRLLTETGGHRALNAVASPVTTWPAARYSQPAAGLRLIQRKAQNVAILPALARQSRLPTWRELGQSFTHRFNVPIISRVIQRTEAPVDTSDLVLAGLGSRLLVSEAEPIPESEDALNSPAESGPAPTMAQLREILAQRDQVAPPPSKTSPPSPTPPIRLQRFRSAPPEYPQPVRPVSQIEERPQRAGFPRPPAASPTPLVQRFEAEVLDRPTSSESPIEADIQRSAVEPGSLLQPSTAPNIAQPAERARPAVVHRAELSQQPKTGLSTTPLPAKPVLQLKEESQPDPNPAQLEQPARPAPGAVQPPLPESMVARAATPPLTTSTSPAQSVQPDRPIAGVSPIKVAEPPDEIGPIPPSPPIQGVSAPVELQSPQGNPAVELAQSETEEVVQPTLPEPSSPGPLVQRQSGPAGEKPAPHLLAAKTALNPPTSPPRQSELPTHTAVMMDHAVEAVRPRSQPPEPVSKPGLELSQIAAAPVIPDLPVITPRLLTGVGQRRPITLTQSQPAPTQRPLIRRQQLPFIQLQSRYRPESPEASAPLVGQGISVAHRPEVKPGQIDSVPALGLTLPLDLANTAVKGLAEPAASLPLPVIRQASASGPATVQRQAATSAPPAEPPFGQPASTANGSASAANQPEAAKAVNLDRLAQQIYPLIKQRLRIEQQQTSRW